MSPDLHHPSSRLAPSLYAAGLLLLPLAYPGLWGTSSDLLPKRMLLYALGFGIAAVWLWVTRSGRSSWPRAPLTLPAVVYALINLLSLSWSTHPFSGWVEAVQLLALLFLFLGLLVLLRPRHILTLAQFSTLGGLLVSVVGIAQYLGLGFDGILSVGLPSSTFIFRNLAAAYLVGNLPLGLLALLLDPVPRRKLLWGIATGASLLFLFYTRTRGAWVGIAGALLLAGVLLLTQRSLRQALQSHFASLLPLRWSLALCILALLAATALPARTSREIIQRFDEKKTTPVTAAASLFTPGSDRGRMAMWRHTWEIIWDHPLLGIGLDNWEFVYPLYDRGDKITDHSEPVRPHNDFLWIASEIGLIGFALYLYLLSAAAHTILGLLRTGSPETRAAALACTVGLAALLGHSLFSFPKEQPASAALFWLHLGILGLLSARRESPPPAARLAWIVPCLGLLLSVGALHLTWRQVAFDRYYHRARAYQGAGMWKEAFDDISLALNRGTFDHRARFLQGLVLHRSGQHRKAELAYQHALRVHPNYAHTHHNLGLVYAAQKEWSRAIASYQKALDIRPGYIQARINLGNAYDATGRLDAAVREFKRALRDSPGSPDTHSNLGAVYLKQGDLDSAIPALREAVRLRPDHAQAFNNLAYAYEQKGLYREAIGAYESLLKYWKGDDAYAETVRQHLNSLRNRLEN